MIVILNGSFGVGTTTVAKLVAAKVARTVVYDPERWGYVLQRLPPWLLGRAAPVEDSRIFPCGTASSRAASGGHDAAQTS